MSWRGANNGLPATGISALAIDPQNSSNLFVGTVAEVFKSSDGGQSWVALNYPGLRMNGPNTASPGVQQLSFDSLNPSTLYAVAGRAVFEITFVSAT